MTSPATRNTVFSAGGVRGGTLVWMTDQQLDVWRGSTPPTPALPVNGEGGGAGIRLAPLVEISAGDRVIAHDGRLHVVRQVMTTPYSGDLIGIATDASEKSVWMTPDTRILARLRPRTLGGKRDWSGSPEVHQERRRSLRREATIAERKLWNALRGSSTGFKFRRQHSLGPYIADFYSRDAHLVIEIDGEGHYTAEGRAHDRRRDAFLRGLGLDVLRVPVTELDDNLEGVWLAIREQCRLRTQSVGEGEWVQAAGLLPGDRVFEMRGPPLGPPANGGRDVGEGLDAVLGGTVVRAVACEAVREGVFTLEVDGASSFVTEIGAIRGAVS